MQRHFLKLLILPALVLSFMAQARDVEIINKTGLNIRSMYFADERGKRYDLLNNGWFEAGDSLVFDLRSDQLEYWDLIARTDSDSYLEWYHLDLSAVSYISIYRDGSTALQ